MKNLGLNALMSPMYKFMFDYFCTHPRHHYWVLMLFPSLELGQTRNTHSAISSSINNYGKLMKALAMGIVSDRNQWLQNRAALDRLKANCWEHQQKALNGPNQWVTLLLAISVTRTFNP